MTAKLPPLRPELDVFPSSDPDRPGYVLRDPYQYTDLIAIVPPVLASVLPYFDGEHTELDVRAHLTRLTGEIEVGEVVRSFVDSLSSSGFLRTPEFEQMRDAAHEEFAKEPERLPAHSGSGYPEDPDALRERLREYLENARRVDGDLPPDANPRLRGIAAPHVSPEGGWRSYATAYGALGPHLADRTFVILGTSHYGEPERFGLTRKGYRTPLGLARTDVDLVDLLAREAPGSVWVEDYCHAIEHSIEFQIIFLQCLVAPDVRVLPILCGPFQEALLQQTRPESNPRVGTFFDTLGRLAESRGTELFWVLGVDLAHVGARYGDPVEAVADRGPMEEVRVRDLARLDRVVQADPGGFLELVQPDQDELKWCGFSPIYTFLRVVPEARGQLWRYEQWNIDDASVVSFAAIGFE